MEGSMTTVTRKVYELRWQHDEGYYPVMVFADKEEADRVAAGSLKFLEEPDDDFARFAVVERDVVVGTGEWGRQDYIDAVDPWEIEDFFLPEDEETT